MDDGLPKRVSKEIERQIEILKVCNPLMRETTIQVIRSLASLAYSMGMTDQAQRQLNETYAKLSDARSAECDAIPSFRLKREDSTASES